MIFWLRFALRSVLRRRRRTLITFISVGLGVAMLIVLGSIMVGVNDTMVKNAVAINSGNLVIETPPLPLNTALQETESWEQVLQIQEILYVLPRYTLPAILRHGERVQALQLTLVNPEQEKNNSPIPDNISAGHWLHEQEGLVIGSGLAESLAVSTGEIVRFSTSDQHFELPVTGIFHTGVQSLDYGLGYLPIAVAQKLALAANVRLQLAVFTTSGSALPTLQRQLQSTQGTTATISTWQQKLPEVEQLVQLNEFSMQIMILLVIAILAFGVANSLLISVMDRYRYYGILKAIGVRPQEVVITVVGEALVICLGAGLIGTLVGMIVGSIWGQIGLDISHYTSYNPHFSINPVIYPRLTVSMVFLPQVLALITGVLASVWPALVAAGRQVNSSMRDL
ncbi:FtsX-like permease family protein [uncultured Desulfuromusa sp.]|uniref:ABC transporter permease n=1 Tax=uncultured Desulfuromusa sp. TaxID=219183 RepID=UPI002AA73A42|nr:FtsX-like permease family protein [uncultured Desulfuromusa sp.]